MSVRIAVPEDLLRVSELAAKGLRELGEVPDVDRVNAKVLEAYEKAPCILYEKDRIQGMWGLTAFRPYFSNKLMLMDYMFYIEPDYRSFRAAKMMVEAVKKIANDHKIDIELNYMITHSFDKKMRLFEMMGFKKTGLKGVYNGK